MLRRRVLWSAAVLIVVLAPGVAGAQVPIDPTATPVSNNGGWVGGLNVLMLGLALLLTGGFVFGYMKFSGRFRKAEGEEDTAVLRPGRPAPRVELGAVAPRPPMPAPELAMQAAAVVAPTVAPPPAAASAPAPAPAAVAAPAPASAPSAPAPAAPSAPDAAPEVEPQTAPPASVAPAPPAAPAAPAGEVEPDRETYDRVMQEQLDKGVDRRIAEGRAKSAAIRAARQKAGG